MHRGREGGEYAQRERRRRVSHVKKENKDFFHAQCLQQQYRLVKCDARTK